MPAPHPDMLKKYYGDSDRDLEFTCPKCGGHEFTSDKRGDGSNPIDFFPVWGHCSDPSYRRCQFMWNRDTDHLYFKKPETETIDKRKRRVKH